MPTFRCSEKLAVVPKTSGSSRGRFLAGSGMVSMYCCVANMMADVGFDDNQAAVFRVTNDGCEFGQDWGVAMTLWDR